MFLLDGKRNTFTEEDRLRRNKIALLLQDWGLLTIKNPDVIGDMSAFNSKIDVIPYKEKSKYTLVAKYTIGKSKGKK
jgi:Bacteriophage translational regulator